MNNEKGFLALRGGTNEIGKSWVQTSTVIKVSTALSRAGQWEKPREREAHGVGTSLQWGKPRVIK